MNLVVALIRSNQFEAAQKELEKISKADSQNTTLKGIKAFFLLKDKKFDEALAQVAQDKDTYSLFLRAQIFLAKSKVLFFLFF